MNLIIGSVASGGLAEEIGLEPGDQILSVDGEEVDDSISFSYLASEDVFTLEVRKKNGETWEIEVERDYGESFGIEFESPVAKPKTCANRCLFCFLEQSPPGLRASLRVKDDDYRLSFLHGNFITLTNLSQKEWRRIIAQRLSPLYVSIHATDPKIRETLLGNRRAGRIYSQLVDLTESGIKVHGQIVLCPGINDGAILRRTLEDLKNLGPGILSVAIVPVGLTGYRSGLPPIPPVQRDLAADTIEMVEKMQEDLSSTRDTRWVWAADEFYLIAGKAFPAYETYENFPQMENGVGLAATFLHDFAEAAEDLPEKVHGRRSISIASSISGGKVITGAVERLRRIKGLDICLWTVPNTFFSGYVTVAGLLTGSDLLASLRGKELGEELYIPASCLRERWLFLDNLTLEEVSQALRVPVVPVGRARELVKRVVDKCVGR